MKTSKDIHKWIGETVLCNFLNQDALINDYLEQWEKETRKDERQKTADFVRSMKIEDITDAGSIAEAILKL